MFYNLSDSIFSCHKDTKAQRDTKKNLCETWWLSALVAKTIRFPENLKSIPYL